MYMFTTSDTVSSELLMGKGEGVASLVTLSGPASVDPLGAYNGLQDPSRSPLLGPPQREFRRDTALSSLCLCLVIIVNMYSVTTTFSKLVYLPDKSETAMSSD